MWVVAVEVLLLLAIVLAAVRLLSLLGRHSTVATHMHMHAHHLLAIRVSSVWLNLLFFLLTRFSKKIPTEKKRVVKKRWIINQNSFNSKVHCTPEFSVSKCAVGELCA
jgi:hypothetical protein